MIDFRRNLRVLGQGDRSPGKNDEMRPNARWREAARVGLVFALRMMSFEFVRKWLSREARDRRLFAVGNCVRVARTVRSPLPGELGRILDICQDDPVGPFLVQFANRLQFRYRAEELEIVIGTPALELDAENSSHVESLALKRRGVIRSA
jgi:hypothetical protein